MHEEMLKKKKKKVVKNVAHSRCGKVDFKRVKR